MLTTPRIKLLLATAMLLSLLITLTTTTIGTTGASSKTQGEERQLENLIPKHVPLEIKIRREKEKQFKDLNNETWAEDFELEVTNTGDKPIYEFYLMAITELKWANGDRVLFPILGEQNWAIIG